MFADMEIIGTRLITKLGTLFKFFGAVGAEAQLWKFSVALSNVSKKFWLGKAGIFALGAGYIASASQIILFFRAVISKSRDWILF